MPWLAVAQTETKVLDLPGETLSVTAVRQPFRNISSTPEDIAGFVSSLDTATLSPYLAALAKYRLRHSPDDWLFYQVVRTAAQAISPKEANYNAYTVYKWWLLVQTGYDALITCSTPYLLLYIQSDENVYNIPFRTKAAKQYVCLNYHDYGDIDFVRLPFTEVPLAIKAGAEPFSYKVTRLPEMASTAYAEKELRFNYGPSTYNFRIKLNPQVGTIFTNYPVVDYALQFNMPLSRQTHESLMPSLKQAVKGMNEKEGIEFLMRFTRYAFLFKPDVEVFGKEKRLSAEQTLLYEYSDCEDRAALFFYLVKELYNLPMLVLTYPDHVTIAIAFEKGYGEAIEHEGRLYSVCDPTPQRYDLSIGQLLPELKRQPFEVAYAYKPH